MYNMYVVKNGQIHVNLFWVKLNSPTKRLVLKGSRNLLEATKYNFAESYRHVFEEITCVSGLMHFLSSNNGF